MKISSTQKADIVRRIQVKNPDGTWAVSYKALAPEFGVSSCLISYIAKHAGLPQRKRGKYVPSVGKRLSGRWLRVHDRRRRSLPRCAPHHKLGIQTYIGLASR